MAAMRSLVLVALGALVAQPASAEEEIGIGLPAPSFSLRTLNPEVAGTSWVALDRYVGADAEDPGCKVVLLSFFASWCEPCKREMPFLVQLDRMYREQGLRVLSVDIDREPEGIEDAKRMIAAANVTYPVLSDRFNFLARRYLGDQAPLPSVFIVRRDGLVASIERGYAKDASAFLLAAVQDGLGIERRGARQAAGPVRRGGGATPAAAEKGAAARKGARGEAAR
jgi:thiol-disulfide isomerase/thioredoxin